MQSKLQDLLQNMIDLSDDEECYGFFKLYKKIVFVVLEHLIKAHVDKSRIRNEKCIKYLYADFEGICQRITHKNTTDLCKLTEAFEYLFPGVPQESIYSCIVDAACDNECSLEKEITTDLFDFMIEPIIKPSIKKYYPTTATKCTQQVRFYLPEILDQI